ncbi:uncharacterized protein LOC119185466 isoform X2 [Rhipicephalus microplus]|uniref:uncharacterized protein LOC119185466 isoform X2 n=1 Tax=Rhipicephalus microplus TaxID=6941 RepID=UPI003F6AA137
MKYARSTAVDDSHPPPEKREDLTKVMECVPSLHVEDTADWLEQDVIAGFRVWQLMFLSLGGLIVVVVVMCCFMKCRIPRTKQEIEADFHRKKLTQVFRKHLNKVPVEEVEFKLALEKVKALYEHEQEKRSRGSWDSLAECEDLTLRQRLRKLLRSLKPRSQAAVPRVASSGDDADSESNSAGDSRADAASHSGGTIPSSEESSHAGGCRTIREERISIEEDPDDDVQA